MTTTPLLEIVSSGPALALVHPPSRLPRWGEAACRTPEIVIVDAGRWFHQSLVEDARIGSINLHVCVDGQAALRLARRFRADAWLVNTDLPDTDGFDLVASLLPRIRRAAIDPLIGGVLPSVDDAGHSRHDGVFLVAAHYRLADEQRALASGANGYLVRPWDMDVLDIVLNGREATGRRSESVVCGTATAAAGPQKGSPPASETLASSPSDTSGPAVFPAVLQAARLTIPLR